MDSLSLKFIPLSDLILDRKSFDSTSEELNRYFQLQVFQDVKRKVTNCFVLISDQAIVGYYTLSAGSISLQDLPKETQKKLPRYPTVPVARIGRLALDKKFLKKGLGRLLLIDAIMRIKRADIAAYAVIVDAKDEQAVRFYQKYGFLTYSSNAQLLYCPIANWKTL